MPHDTAIQQLRRQTEEAGLGRVMAELEELAMSSIRIRATRASEDEMGVGHTKLGGIPDLPEGVDWPECDGVPLALLAQLRLEDVAPFDIDKRLPPSGMLYFFYEAKEQAWGFDPEERGNWQVIYYDSDILKLRVVTPPEHLPEEGRFPTCKVRLSIEMTLPSGFSTAVRLLNLTDDELKRYYTLPGGGCGESTTIHRLLGYPEQIQGDMQLECQLASHGLDVGNPSGYKDPRAAALKEGAADWQLLLQIDSDEDNLRMMWGDAGRVYFWIRKQELKARDFSNVWLVLQCY